MSTWSSTCLPRCVISKSERLGNLDAEHRQVVACFRTVDVERDGLTHFFDRRTGVHEFVFAQDFEHLLVAEFLLLPVLGFVQAVGIEEQRLSLDILNPLSLKDKAVLDSDSHIGLAVEERRFAALSGKQNGRIVPAVAEFHRAARQVD